VALEAFESDNEHRWQLEDLDSLNSLLMLLALVAVPLVLPAELLRSVELAEAVSDSNLVDEELLLFGR